MKVLICRTLAAADAASTLFPVSETTLDFEGFVETLVERVVERKLAEQAQTPKLVSKEKLGELLGVAPRTIKTLRAKGLPGHKVGREVFYPVEDAYRWIEQHG